MLYQTRLELWNSDEQESSLACEEDSMKNNRNL